MPTVYDPIDRLAVLTQLDPAVRNLWGTIVDQWPILGAQGAKGFTTIGLSGAAVSLTIANNAADQERYFGWAFTGALSADCTVTIPDIRRAGIAINGTTGGHNVLIKTTSSPVMTLLPGEAALWANIVGIPLVYLSNGRMSSTVAQATPVALVDSVYTNVTSLVLPLGGFWEVRGSVGFNLPVAGSANIAASTSSISGTAQEIRAQLTGPTSLTGTRLTVPTTFISGGSTVYLTGFAAFTGAASAFGYITARKLGGS